MRMPVSFPLVRVARGLAVLCAAGVVGLALAQQPGKPRAAAAPERSTAPQERSVGDWLSRMHEASRSRSYIGTFVVSSGAGAMSSARIWHACDGQRQLERVESLTGQPRSTFRRDDEVLTFLPEQRLVRSERRESLGLFPDLLKPGETAIPEFYTAQPAGHERVAGFDAEVVQLNPKDNLRFGYRIWSERKSGLAIKLQTVGADGQVLEQAAFSELQLDAPVRIDKLAQMMAVPEGWRLEKREVHKTTAASEGWGMKAAVAGFKPMNCYKRGSEGAMQWIFSDGLASVSLFLEPYDRQRHAQEGVFASGATHTLTRRLQDWWLIAVGEVPPQTLKAFAQNLERRK